MRADILPRFTAAPGLPADPVAFLKKTESIYQHDAYHSLSMEGYEVTPELIMQVRSGQWDPDAGRPDMEQRNAMAAKGYANAFSIVCESIRKIFDGNVAGGIVKQYLHDWYQTLFSPLSTGSVNKTCRSGRLS